MKPATGIVLSSVLFLVGWGAGQTWKGLDLEEARQRAGEAARGYEQKIQALEGAVADLSKEREQVQGVVLQKEQEVRDLERKVSGVEGRLAAATKQSSVVAPGKEPELKPMKMMADLMKNPEMREVFKQQQVAQVEMFYGGLFKRFHLNDGEREDLKKLIAARIQADSEFALQAMGGDAPSKDRETALKALKAARDESDLKIKTFLNNEQDYLAYQNWEESKPERMAMSMGQSFFAGSGEPLTSTQEDQLVNAMMAARTRRTNIPDLTKLENLSPENMRPEAIEKILAANDLQAQEVAAVAASFLSPKQLAALKTMQQQQKTMQEMGLKMTGAMFGGKK